MRSFLTGLAFGVLLAATSPAFAQAPAFERALSLTFNTDGTVSLAAHNVTVRDILAEWARQCQCHVVNAEQLPGGAMMLPIQFDHQPQRVVLESLLRPAAGYVLTPRQAGTQSASNYETIFILATSNPVAGAYVPPPVPLRPQLPTRGAPDDELPPVMPLAPTQPQNPATSLAPPSSSSPFGSRSVSEFGPTSAPGQGPAQAPGTATAPPRMPDLPPVEPGRPGAPLPSGTAMPIVAVPQAE